MIARDDLAFLADRQDERRFAGGTPSELPGPLRERIEDVLRGGNVAAVRERAAAADAGESARSDFRAVAWAWLDRAAAEPTAALDARLPPTDPQGQWAPDPERRRRRYDDVLQSLSALDGLRGERAAARRDAAERAGSGSIAAFLGHAHPIPPASTRDAFGVGVVAPLDDAVVAAARERRRTMRVPLLAAPHPADVPLLRALDGFDGGFGERDVVRALAVLGADLRLGPDLQAAPGWLDPAAPRLPVVGRLRASLALLGRSARAGFTSALRGRAAWRFSDPAFDHAAAVLFRRLAQNERFRRRHGPPRDEALERALRLEEALAPREAWTYLDLVLRRAEDETRIALGESDVDEAFRRATGEPATFEQELGVQEADPWGAAALRGTAFGLLVEERLLLRFGREWFERRQAGVWLREMWEAEPDCSAESMAASLGLGTIEAAPIVDAAAP